jgi:hypothetical protein
LTRTRIVPETGLTPAMTEMLRNMPDAFTTFADLNEYHGVAALRPGNRIYAALALRGLVQSKQEGTVVFGRRTSIGKALLR